MQRVILNVSHGFDCKSRGRQASTDASQRACKRASGSTISASTKLHVERDNYGKHEMFGAAGENTCTDGVITGSMHDCPPLQAWILKCDKSDG